MAKQRFDVTSNGKALLRTEMQRLWMQGVALISNGNVQSRVAKAMKRIEEICEGVEKQRIVKATICNELN